MQKIVLITGCSSGIGAALALEFHNRGHSVIATARRHSALAPLAEKGIRTLVIDVDDDASITTAVTTLESEVGQVDILINNAGFSQVGAVIDLSRDDLRRQYETNVIAPVAVTRALFPLLRGAAARNGMAIVVNVGSIVGLFATPFAGAYCSSKAAIHSLSDALRMELAPFGIRVVTVQPGGMRSSFGTHAEEALRLPPGSVYRPVADGVRARARAGQIDATPAEEFARPVVDALLAGTPPIVVRGGRNSFKLPLLKKLLPTAMFDAKLSRIFGLDRLGKAQPE
ncbi:MAG: SDR family NAD(P)-dependent oxidoreductase [Dechloromonas sp.]|jgi:NAD(P)-dependent dehydrogenase (short-subunit alcohol dehydrogenase family)|nr:SDR family NAD(P)-dependent oxidoreductase [Candidatus Dechloromonas phosphoritropha]MBP8785999.1 SDR family NAD(P)-dependent oxidoreductase [Azonexus sp.]MBP9226932.1 SDR family NAD(P)-dependent oxidoreductase [Azonexus sp.]